MYWISQKADALAGVRGVIDLWGVCLWKITAGGRNAQGRTSFSDAHWIPIKEKGKEG